MTEHVPPALCEKSFGREHGLRFADAGDAMFPAFVAAQDVDFDAHEINRHLHVRFGQTRHSDGVLFGRNDHSQVAPNAAVNETANLVPGEVMMIDEAQGKIDMRAAVSERAFETCEPR